MAFRGNRAVLVAGISRKHISSLPYHEVLKSVLAIEDSASLRFRSAYTHGQLMAGGFWSMVSGEVIGWPI